VREGLEAAAEAGAAEGFAAGSVSGPFWPQPAASSASARQAAAMPLLRTAGCDAVATLEITSPDMARILEPTMSSASHDTPASTLTDSEYHRLAHEVLASVEATVDRWLDEDVIDIDTHRTGGLLELAMPDGSKLVLNTQPPLHEIWLAARQGGFHFRYVDGRWLDREGDEFFAKLSACASAQAGKTLNFR
jgi:CyaY protein